MGRKLRSIPPAQGHAIKNRRIWPHLIGAGRGTGGFCTRVGLGKPQEAGRGVEALAGWGVGATRVRSHPCHKHSASRALEVRRAVAGGEAERNPRIRPQETRPEGAQGNPPTCARPPPRGRSRLRPPGRDGIPRGCCKTESRGGVRPARWTSLARRSRWSMGGR